MSKTTARIPADKLKLYEELVATLAGVPRKGDMLPYTSVNGHMFSYLSKGGTLSLRLPAQVRDEFVKKYKAKLSSQYGVVQKEYVEVPDWLLMKTSELKEYFAESFAYVSALKPKPTSRKKMG
jgi:hypothetical protein